eukprot:COSAG02_NODE_694_length_18422_cov_19.850188_11_plen_147_part_00
MNEPEKLIIREDSATATRLRNEPPSYPPVALHLQPTVCTQYLSLQLYSTLRSIHRYSPQPTVCTQYRSLQYSTQCTRPAQQQLLVEEGARGSRGIGGGRGEKGEGLQLCAGEARCGSRPGSSRNTVGPDVPAAAALSKRALLLEGG